MKSRFSTGSADLDRYLGDLRPGDSVLLIQSSARDTKPLLKIFLDFTRKSDTSHLCYLRLNGSRDYLLNGLQYRAVQAPERLLKSKPGLSRWLHRSAGALKRGEVLILDDLADWAGVLTDRHMLARVYAYVTGKIGRKQGLCLTTVLRSSLDNAALASLKEASSVCLEITSSGGNLLVQPLQISGRIPSGAAAPFGFMITRRVEGKKRRLVPVQDFESPHGEKIRGEFLDRGRIAAEILEGPLGAVPIGMLIADLEGTFLAANGLLKRLFGIPDTTGELPDPLSFVGPETRRAFLRLLSGARRGSDAWFDLTAGLTGKGPLPLRIRPLPVEGGLTLFLVEVKPKGDVTGARSGEVRERFGALFADNPLPMGIADRKKITHANGAFAAASGRGRLWPGPLSLSACFPPKTLRPVREGIETVLGGGGSATIRGSLSLPEGKERPVRISIARAASGGEGSAVITLEDVSEYASRIASLEEDDRRFRTIAEQLSRPVALMKGMQLVYGNPRLAGMLLGPGGTAIPAGRALPEFIPEEEREAFTDAFAKFLGSRHAEKTFDTTIMNTAGERTGVRATLRKLQGIPEAGILMELEDVTERRREEERLTGMQAGTDRIRAILEAATGTLEYEKLLHTALDRSLEVLGWSGGVVFMLDTAGASYAPAISKRVPKKLLDRLSELPAREGLGGYVSKTLESHVFPLDRYPSFLPFRTLFRDHGIRGLSLIPLVHGDEPVGFILGLSGEERKADPVSLGTLTTLGRQLGNALVNARKLSAVRASEQKFHTVVDSLAGIVYTAGPDGTILTIDAAVTGILGYSPRDFDRNHALFLSLLHEQDKRIYLERVTGSAGLGAAFVREYRMRPRAKAAFRWMRDTVSVMRDQNGNVAGFTGILADVTEEHEKYSAAVSEHTILRTVQDALPDGIGVFDDGGQCLDWNPTMERITGIARGQALGKKARSIAPFPSGFGEEDFNHAVSGRKPARLGLVEAPGVPGSRYETFMVPVPGRAEAGPGFLLRYADVTDRQAEVEQLLESEKILLNVINAMDDVMMITDLGGRVVEVNQAFLKVMRYPRSRVVGQEFPYPWLVERDMGRFMVWISRIREQQWLHDFDVTWVADGGAEVQMSLNTTLIRNSMGEPVAMLNIARDISERVRLTHEVESRNNQIEMINRVATLATRTNDFTEIFGAVADEVVRLMPAQAVFTFTADGPGSPFSRAAAFDGEPLAVADVERFAAAVRGASPGDPPDLVIPDMQRDPGSGAPGALAERFRSAVAVPIDEHGKPPSMLVVAAREPHAYGEEHAAILRPLARQLGEIISRLRLFARVVSDSQFVGNLLDSVDSPVYTVDEARVITRINRAGSEFLHSISPASAADLVGARLLELLPESSLRDAVELALGKLETGAEPRYTGEVAIAGPAGSRTTRLIVNVLRDGGMAKGFVFSHIDITALKATEAELRERASQLITLHEISAAISSTFDIDAIFQTALTLLKSALGAKGMIVYLAGPAEGGLTLRHQEGFDPAAIGAVARLDPERSITGDVVRRRVPSYVARKVSADERIAPANRGFLERFGLDAMAVVPIMAREKVLGALDIFYDTPHEFTEHERRVLNLAGNQLGAAIENGNLYAELTAQVDRLRVLFELSQRLTSLLDTAEICRAAFEHIRRAVECERCSIFLSGGEGAESALAMEAVRAGGEFRIGEIPRERRPPLAGASGEASGTSRSRRSPDGGTAVIPMVSEDAILGVIEAVRGDGRPFDEVQLRLLESFASLTAIAVQKAGLYEETVRTSRQIERRNRELDDFTYVVSHDLKEPLISIEGFARILQMDYSDVIRSEGKEYLDSLVGATTRMKGLIDDLLMLSRVSRPTESFRMVDLSAVVAEVRADMEFLIRKKNVGFRVDPALPAVMGNETQLKILFRNLIGNAVKFNDKPDPVVEVGFRSQENNSYLFWVKDNGIGIDPEFFEKIFVIFQRLHRREEFEGSGAGLAIVKKIMEIHHGNVWVESQKGTGSMFCFTLPAPPAGT